MKDVLMPALGVAMEEGTLVSWLKQPGDVVRAGDPIAEIETDKAVVEIESPADGRLGSHLHAAGAVVPIGGRISFILEADDPS